MYISCEPRRYKEDVDRLELRLLLWICGFFSFLRQVWSRSPCNSLDQKPLRGVRMAVGDPAKHPWHRLCAADHVRRLHIAIDLTPSGFRPHASLPLLALSETRHFGHWHVTLARVRHNVLSKTAGRQNSTARRRLSAERTRGKAARRERTSSGAGARPCTTSLAIVLR